jgi:hypothetical protein
MPLDFVGLIIFPERGCNKLAYKLGGFVHLMVKGIASAASTKEKV